MERRNFIITFLLLPVLLAGAGALRPPAIFVPTAMTVGAFYHRKIHSGPHFDLVLAGDSRAQAGLSPAAMGKEIPGLRIINFGFPGAGYSREYLDAVAARLDPRSPRPIIALAVSPLSLTSRATQLNKFIDAARADRLQGLAEFHLPRPIGFFDPIPLRDIVNALLRRPPPTVTYQERHPDGWAVDRIVPPPADFTNQLTWYRNYFSDRKSPLDLAPDLLAAVREWSGRGALVVGFRLPAHPEMMELEEDAGGFHPAEFGKDLEAAGGKWLVFDPSRYPTFDGSHLTREAALAFSRDLARQIASLLRAETGKTPHER